MARPLADAFFVAQRLPNHFRAIFAESAFNAAFVPAYPRVHGQGGPQAAGRFADRIFTLLLGVEIILWRLALIFTPAVISVLAPVSTQRFELSTVAHAGYLSVSRPDLIGHALRRHPQFPASFRRPGGSSDPAQLRHDGDARLVAWFSDAGHAAAWGVLISGILQALMVGGDAWRQGAAALRCLSGRRRPETLFPRAGPAALGSAGTQIALFADTIIASLLPVGALSALYYADRLDQLPIGVIGIAAGTVLLPEMAGRLAAGDEAGARVRRTEQSSSRFYSRCRVSPRS